MGREKGTRTLEKVLSHPGRNDLVEKQRITKDAEYSHFLHRRRSNDREYLKDNLWYQTIHVPFRLLQLKEKDTS